MDPNKEPEFEIPNTEPTVTLSRSEARTLIDLAVHGYNAELKYKSARRYRGERPSEYAMRKADEKRVIESVREHLIDDPAPEPTPVLL